MATSSSSAPKVVSREEWLAIRKAFFLKEKAMTHELDALRAERRRLPWVKVEKPYAFDGPEGECTLADLFRGHSQLAIYHFMLAPDSDHVCKGCSFVADHFDAARQHFGDADLSFAVISRAPLARIEQVKRALGWTFPWVSSRGSDFNYGTFAHGLDLNVACRAVQPFLPHAHAPVHALDERAQQEV